MAARVCNRESLGDAFVLVLLLTRHTMRFAFSRRGIDRIAQAIAFCAANERLRAASRSAVGAISPWRCATHHGRDGVPRDMRRCGRRWDQREKIQRTICATLADLPCARRPTRKILPAAKMQ